MEVVKSGAYEARLADVVRSVRDVLRRRYLVLAAVTAAVTIVGVLLTLTITPTYEGVTRIQIDPSRNPLARAQNEAQAQLASEAIETEVAVINSLDLARDVARRLNLVNDPEFAGEPAADGEETLSAEAKLDQVARAVQQRLSASRDRLTYIIVIRFSSEDPEKAARIANTFAAAYLDAKVGTKIGTAERQSDYYQSQLDKLAADVSEADQRVATFQAQTGLVPGSSNQQGTVVDQQIAPLALQLASAESIAAEARAKEVSARQLVARGQLEAISNVRESGTIQELRRQRAVLIQTLEDVENRYGGRHPDLIKVRDQLQAVDAQLREEAGRVIQSLDADAAAAEARAASLRSTMAQLEDKQAEIVRASVIAAGLQRNADSQHAAYDKMAQLALEARQAAQNSIAQAEIIDTAQPPPAPNWPNRPLLSLLSLLVGFAAGVAVITTQELMTSGMRSIEEIETELGVPLIAAVPKVTGETRPADLLLRKPTSQFAEALRNARASIIGVRGQERPKVIAVTSALPREGKTTTALALARTMALNGDSTIIVDADVRRALLRQLTDEAAPDGLVELLHGQASLDDVIHPSGLEKLDQILVREPYFTSENLFGHDLIHKVIDELSQRYDVVILDLPPLVGLSDGRFLAALADAVVMVIKWNDTPKHAVKSAVDWLRGDGSKLVGAIYTMVDASAHSLGSYYYYSEKYSEYYNKQ